MEQKDQTNEIMVLCEVCGTQTVYSSDQERVDFFIDILTIMNDGDIPFLLGGAYAVECYTGVHRDTKDLDLFVRLEDCSRVCEYMEEQGFVTERTHHWLAKAKRDSFFVDFIFSSANGVCAVDDEWFENANESVTFGIPVPVMPVEEMLWQKCYIMEKERYDGADVNHLLRAHGGSLNWKRLVNRFASHWRVLYSHVVMFGFVYPQHQKECIPQWFIEECGQKMVQEQEESSSIMTEKLCYGTLLSRAQYLTDIFRWNYGDPRKEWLDDEEIRDWTLKIPRLEIYDQNIVKQRNTTHANGNTESC